MKTQKKLKGIIEKPLRDADHISNRGVAYWWGPEWVRDLNGTITRIVALKVNDDVELHMVSKDGNVSYIQGRIQQAFKQWHADRQIDYLLLGVDPDELLAAEWQNDV